jgi:antitoxin component HigA of HigAB toxin-antitoxin module
MTVQTLERKLKPFAEPLEGSLLKWLYCQLPPQPITSRRMHGVYMKALVLLMEEKEKGALDAASQKAVSGYLSSIAPFIEGFEKKEFPMGSATPEEMLRFFMEQNGLSQYDLAEELGGQPVVSEVLRGKRKLNREHIERLARRFGVSPATFYPG